MKKLLVIVLALGVTFAAEAQPKIGGGFRGGSVGGGVHYIRPRVTVVAPAYPYYYSGLGYGFGLGLGLGYSPFYDPFYRQRVVEERPSQLDLQLQDIKNEYDFKISTVKHDKSLDKDQRKQQVRDLKHQKEDAIIEAKKDYYKALDEKRNQNNG